MRVVERSTVLEASADAVWAAVKTPAAFRRVTRGILAMPVIGGRQDDWREGETVVGWVFLFGFLPFSRHHLHVAGIDESKRVLSSREHGGLISAWNHDIEVLPIDAVTCRYRDDRDRGRNCHDSGCAVRTLVLPNASASVAGTRETAELRSRMAGFVSTAVWSLV